MIITYEMNLSPTMLETIKKIEEHGKLVRYTGGFGAGKGANSMIVAEIWYLIGIAI